LPTQLFIYSSPSLHTQRLTNAGHSIILNTRLDFSAYLNTLLYGNVHGPTNDCSHHRHSNVWPDVKARNCWRLQSVI